MEAQRDLFSEEKNEEARLERERASVPQQPPPPGVMSVPMYSTPGMAPGMVTTIQPVLPPQLWPHNFLYLSIALAVVLGFFNPFTLTGTIPAVVLGSMGYLQSKNGKYKTAKVSSKMTLMILVVAVIIFAVFWFSGWIPGVFYLTYFIYG